MTGVLLNIESAFQEAIISSLAASGITTLDIPGTPGTPTAGVPWARLTSLPVQTYPAGAGIDSLTVHPGVYQVSLFFPTNQGQKAILEAASSLCSAFKRGSYLVKNDTVVMIHGSYRGPFISDPAWLHCPITIRWQAEQLDV